MNGISREHSAALLATPSPSPSLKPIAAERETGRSWMSWPSTSCNKAPQERPSRRGGGEEEEVSEQQPAVACTFSYWLSPLSTALVRLSDPLQQSPPLSEDPRPCPLIFYLSITSVLLRSRYKLIGPQQKWASPSMRAAWRWNRLQTLSVSGEAFGEDVAVMEVLSWGVWASQGERSPWARKINCSFNSNHCKNKVMWELTCLKRSPSAYRPVRLIL